MITNLTVKERYIFQLEVEKSKFIGVCLPVFSKDEFEIELKKIKQEFPKARHYCYAYVIGNDEKYNDDGEPQGTAGNPILNQIKQANLRYAAIVVVRYFGGVLLGSGRLLRSYVKCASSVLGISVKQEVINMKKYRITVQIENFESIKKYLMNRQYIIKNITFNDKITLDFLADESAKKDLEINFLNKYEFVGEIDYLYRKEIL